MENITAISQPTILQSRLERIQRRILSLSHIENRYPWIRLAVLLAGLILFFFSTRYNSILLSAVTFMGGLTALSITAYLHNQVIEALEKSRLLETFIKQQIARQKLDWDDIPVSPSFTLPSDHPFVNDLQLVGPRSLHQLLNIGVSLGGSQRLLNWLTNRTPDLNLIKRRQNLIQLLKPLFGLQTRLVLASRYVLKHQEHWDGQALIKWLEQDKTNSISSLVLLSLFALSILNISLFILFSVGMLPAYWLFSLVVYFGLQSLCFANIKDLFEDSYHLSSALATFSAVTRELENYPFENNLLAELCAPIRQSTFKPSRLLRRTSIILSAVSLQNNPFLALFLNLLVPWSVFFGFLLNRLKKDLLKVLPSWLEIWYELEALLSLANFSLLNPEYTFPDLIDTPQQAGPVFSTVELGHPLLPAQQRINNNFELSEPGQLDIITGSNMSGKSTFLRTVGINLVLAYAGSVTCSTRFSACLMRLFTCISVSDSLSDGISYFYAEVTRLKQLLDALHTPGLPLLFLIDEIFRGTNNTERRIGSQAYIHALVYQNGVGLISTHDLELTSLAQTVSGVRNFHFKESIANNQMVFDYIIRPGPCPTTNALKIMRLVGLPVPTEDESTHLDAAPIK
jgi:hypothetical protein